MCRLLVLLHLQHELLMLLLRLHTQLLSLYFECMCLFPGHMFLGLDMQLYPTSHQVLVSLE